ncbi:integrase core domain-containing protein [Caballeronia sordidicola]|uniref:integrase core domain-containing protein n=1 Tax=Caballeronia sordidicola TaxID=196367 RepID=UPI0035940EF2
MKVRNTPRTTFASRSNSGVAASYAFVAKPQTNGVAERFNRTLMEKATHGRIFKNLEEVRTAAVAFKD